jgi:hypothetical protein
MDMAGVNPMSQRSTHVRHLPRRKGIYLALASLLAAPFVPGTAFADCTLTGTTVTCASASGLSYTFATNNVTVNIQPGAQLYPTLLLGGPVLTLTGNNINVDNHGTVDPALAGALTIVSGGLVVGNAGANTINITNESDGAIKGLVNLGSLLGIGGQAILVQNGSGGTATIVNNGTIDMNVLGLGLLNTSDAPAILSYGGGRTNMTNTGYIRGRIGFAPSLTAGQGNTFINAGTISGSVNLGATATGNTFTAVSGSSVLAEGAGRQSRHHQRQHQPQWQGRRGWRPGQRQQQLPHPAERCGDTRRRHRRRGDHDRCGAVHQLPPPAGEQRYVEPAWRGGAGRHHDQ